MWQLLATIVLALSVDRRPLWWTVDRARELAVLARADLDALYVSLRRTLRFVL